MTAIHDTLKIPMRSLTILTVGPASHAKILREQIVDYFTQYFQADRPIIADEMLNIALAPVGQSQPTHYACERVGWDAELGHAAAGVVRLRKQFGEPYAKRILTFEDSRDSLLSGIYVMESTIDQFCARLNLERVG